MNKKKKNVYILRQILVFRAAEYSRNVVAVKNACPMTTAQKLKKQEILKRTRRHDYALFISFSSWRYINFVISFVTKLEII